MQYILGKEQYSDVLKEYIKRAHIKMEPLSHYTININLSDPRYDPADVMKMYEMHKTGENARYVISQAGANPHLLLPGCNINHRHIMWGTQQHACNSWAVYASCSGQYGDVKITLRNDYYVVQYMNSVWYYPVFTGVESDWGLFSPHIVRGVMAIGDHKWHYPCDVKFDF